MFCKKATIKNISQLVLNYLLSTYLSHFLFAKSFVKLKDTFLVTSKNNDALFFFLAKPVMFWRKI